MSKGLTATSSPIAISHGVSQTTNVNAPNTSTTNIDLQLNPLDNEVFVVTAVKIDFQDTMVPDASLAGLKNFFQEISICKARPADAQNLANSNVVGSSRMLGFAQVDTTGPFIPISPYTLIENSAMDSPPATQDYLDIIATDNFFIQFNTSADLASQSLSASVRVYGYRARATSAVYAALVQSEMLSAN
ncbi:hypothetical protein [Poseidonia sp.]|uniref:hypothetical protein n=1 Tax=Poseidonia sp. TaxID=2666344 RepID=UPI003F69B3B4